MSDLTFRQLEILSAILREKSVTRAAERLNLPQSNASGVLARARDVTGDALLARTSGGFTRTDRGDDVLSLADGILAAADAIVVGRNTYDPGQDDGAMTIEAIDYVQMTIVPRLLTLLRSEAPHLRLAIRPIDRFAVRQRLERGEVDLAFIPTPAAPPGLRVKALLHEDFLCIGSVGHPAFEEKLGLDDFCSCNHVLVSPNRHDFEGLVDERLAATGRSRKVVVSAPSFASAVAIVSQSDLIATIPRRFAEAGFAATEVAPVPIEIGGFDLCLAWHERTQDSERHRWFRDRVQNALR